MTDEITIEGSQDYSIDINKVTAIMTLEDGVTTASWNMGDSLSLTLPPTADVNADGRVEFTVACDVTTSFTNVSTTTIQLKRYIQGGYFKGTIKPEAWTTLAPIVKEYGPTTTGSMSLDFTSPEEIFSFQLGGFNTAVFTGAIDLGPSSGGPPPSGPPENAALMATSEALTGSVFEPVFPYTIVAQDIRAAQSDAELVLRLRSEEAITTETILATILPDGYAGEQLVMDLKPVAEGDLTDVWVTFQMADGWALDDFISLAAGASTLNGGTINSLAHFQIESAEEQDARAALPDLRIWQPQPGVDFDPEGMDLNVESADEVVITLGAKTNSPPLSIGIGTPFTIGPECVYTQPQRVWLPVPKGVDPNAVRIYYHHGAGANPGWYPAEAVEDWLVPENQLFLDVEDTTYIGFLIRHAGIAQLGVPAVGK